MINNKKGVIVGVNTFNIGSTGRIMLQIGTFAEKMQYTFIPFYPKCRDNSKKNPKHGKFIGDRITRNIHYILGEYFGLEGFGSLFATYKFIKQMKEINPNIIHLHNIHGCYLNFPILFKYIKKYNLKVVWTLHDCWTFTGRCPYFIKSECDKWKVGCGKCVYPKNEYPYARRDTTHFMWKSKKRWFQDIQQMIIVTPSKWLAGLVKQSYLSSYEVKVINNGIDIEKFKPVETAFRKNNGITYEEKIILGVAFNWDERKGLDVFLELFKRLDQGKYKIVLVGTNSEVDKKLPKEIISIHRTDSQEQLAEIYSAADCFVNPTREDNFPTVNLEALACGTPVVSFDVGGSIEMLTETTGIGIKVGDIESMESAVKEVCISKKFTCESCRNQALKFDYRIKMKNYVQLYERINGNYDTE